MYSKNRNSIHISPQKWILNRVSIPRIVNCPTSTIVAEKVVEAAEEVLGLGHHDGHGDRRHEEEGHVSHCVFYHSFVKSLHYLLSTTL